MRVGIQTKQHIDMQKELAKSYNVGDNIYFMEQKKSYKIKARTDRYMICTKPFNLKKTYQYCIVDLEEGIRGPDNYLDAHFDYADTMGAINALIALAAGDIEISSRRRAVLNIGKLGETST